MTFENPMIKIQALIFQNQHGSKYYSRYYTSPEQKSNIDLGIEENQKKFQLGLRKQAERNAAKPDQTQIFVYEGYTVFYKILDQLQIFLIVDENENFVLMEDVINLITQVLTKITKTFTPKIIFDNLQDIVLVADEIIHEGYIVCMDADEIFNRMRMSNNASSPVAKKVAGQPQQQGGTFSSLFGMAKNTFSKTLNLG